MKRIVFISKIKVEMKLIVIPLIFLLLTGCQLLPSKNETLETNPVRCETNIITEDLKDWVDAINNKKLISIQDFYSTESIKIISADITLNSRNDIADYYLLLPNKIISISSLFHVEASKEKNINYELIEYETEDEEVFVQLVIWKLDNEKKIREFEFTSKRSEVLVEDEESIANRRNLWVQLCNAHDPKNLVNELYSSTSYYFNHRPLIKGQDNLIKEYGYMKNENYNLTLAPLKLEFVNTNLAYEIGQCEGSYKGKYILVWKKEFDGNWKVFVDSNV